MFDKWQAPKQMKKKADNTFFHIKEEGEGEKPPSMWA